MKNLSKKNQGTTPITMLPDGIYKINWMVPDETPVIMNAGEAAVSLTEIYTDDNRDRFDKLVLDKTNYVSLPLEQQPVMSGFPKTILLTLTPSAYDNSMHFFGKLIRKIGRTALVVQQRAFVVELNNLPDENRQLRLAFQTDSSYKTFCALLASIVAE